MSPRAIDLDTYRALRRDVDRLAAEHSELHEERASERCAAWLADEAPDDAEEEEDEPLSERD